MAAVKDLNVSVLIDLYGELLTEKQKSVMDMYFNMDYSLSEIAENEGISRQGVLDDLKRGERRLRELDAALALTRRLEKTEQGLSDIEKQLDGVDEKTRSRILRVITGIRAVWEEQ